MPHIAGKAALAHHAGMNMAKDAKTTHICALSGALLAQGEFMQFALLRPALAQRIRADHPHIHADAWLARDTVDEYRSRYITELLEAEHGEVKKLDRDVAASMARNDTIAMDTDDTFAATERRFGERMADVVANFGGSWSFILSFGFVLSIWILINALLGDSRAFDPFPFILLNLILSCLAAIQAPIIMMSQKRQEAKDRLRSQSDYRVNLKAELEIRHLHEKLDHLIMRQWERLAEIQQLQVELLQEIKADSSERASLGVQTKNMQRRSPKR